MTDLREENAFIDTRDIAETIGREFVNADISQYKDHGVDLALGAKVFVERYAGKVRFVNQVLKPALKQQGGLTQGQARAALNIMRQELGVRSTEETPAYEQTEMECFVCHQMFPSWDELNAHKSQEHGKQKPPEVFAEQGEAQAVIEVTASIKGLDLSNLPDGRYCAPDPSGKNDYIFLMVKRVRRTHSRDRRYVYGKIVTGNEVVVAGTIEVKEWSSDSKELIGEQKPGDVYRGKFEDELELIMLMPEPWALLFGKLKGHCCICGKTLTDQVSRDIGMGLECEKKEKYFYRPPKYSFVGTDRPDKEKIDPNDDKYLSGIWKSYVKPPTPTP